MNKEDYSRPKRAPFPRDLAAMIASQAEVMGKRLEDQAIKQMVHTAQRALDRGISPANIASELGLK